MFVGVAVGLAVFVRVSVIVHVRVSVCVGVAVRVIVYVGLFVCVGEIVYVAVGVGISQHIMLFTTAYTPINSLLPYVLFPYYISYYNIYSTVKI